MRSSFSIPLIIVTTLFFSQCARQNDIETQRLSWITEDPLTIPYRIRFQRYERPNLIRNGSFETGRTYEIAGGRISFVVDGWQQVGQNVEWVDVTRDSSYGADEVFSGVRSVKIIRDKAYETDDQGEGMISDFIRVIPGNYDFTFYTRLQNIVPNRFRLGTRMYDAIEVQLLYYDRNKILLDSKQYFPQRDQYIDHSNKSLSFANYLSIPSFDWGKITGKSYPFPFRDGDIPSNAHYIKVYMGLKGTGTMWIDSVTLRYTLKNFSIAERMSLYADSSFSMHQMIIPTPKEVRNLGSVVYFSPESDDQALPVIVVPENACNVTLKAANLLREAIFQGILTATDRIIEADDIPIVSGFSTARLEESKLVFSLGNTAIYRQYRKIMPVHDIEGHDQGYFIDTGDDFSNLVFLNGNNETGIYYAVLTAIQLFDRKQPVFHNARITDYPDFERRHYMISDWNTASLTSQSLQVAEALMDYKMNGALLEVYPGNASSAAFGHVEQFSSISGSKDLFRTYGMISSGKVYPDSSGSVTGNGDTGNERMQKMTNMALSAGMDGIVFAPSFRMPHDSSLCYSYSSIPEVDTDLAMNNMVDIRRSVLTGYPGRAFFYCPPQFNNELLDLSHTFGVQTENKQGIPILWSGYSFFGTQTDEADAERFIDHTGGMAPVFIDNSMLIATAWGQFGGIYPYYPGRLKLYNIFEPFGNTVIRDIFPKLDPSHIFINQTANSEINMIRLATAADFIWNIKQYEPDYSLWKVLVMRYGIPVARELIAFAGKYAEMLEIVLRLDNNEQVARNLKDGNGKLETMNDLLLNLEDSLGSEHKLIKELWLLQDYVKKTFDFYQNNATAE